MTEKPKRKNEEPRYSIRLYILIFVMVLVVVFVIMMLLSPAVGNVFSNIVLKANPGM